MYHFYSQDGKKLDVTVTKYFAESKIIILQKHKMQKSHYTSPLRPFVQNTFL